MLEPVKQFIREVPDIAFGEYYQKYIFRVQDQNITAEVNSVKTDNILSLDMLIDRLYKELYY